MRSFVFWHECLALVSVGFLMTDRVIRYYSCGGVWTSVHLCHGSCCHVANPGTCMCPECLLSSLLLSLHGPESFNILWFSLCWVVCDYPTFHVPMFCVKFACLELLSVFPVLFWRAVSLVSVSRFPCLVMSNQSQLSPSCLPFPDCPVCI